MRGWLALDMSHASCAPGARDSKVRYVIGHAIESDAAWDALARQPVQSSIFLTSAWGRAWTETLGRQANVMSLRAYCGSELVAAGAFVADSGIVEFAGRGPTDYHDILLSSTLTDHEAAQVLQTLLATVAQATPGFRQFRLGRIPAHSRTLRLLSSTRFYVARARDVEAPRMAMSNAPLALQKQSLRRHTRALSRLGTVEIVTYRHAADVLPRLDAFFALHVARWAGSDAPSLFVREENRAFYRALTRALDPIGALRYCEVRLDGRLVAAHFGFLLDGCFTWYKPCFDPALARYSPGEVLLRALIEQCVDERVEIFDFTIGNEAFKQRFATDTPYVMRVSLTTSAARHAVRRARGWLARTWH